MNYQPVYGESLPFQRKCDDRYEPIRELASKFNRPFSVLDIGANFGYFDFRLMAEFDCTCVLVDRKPVLELIRKHAPGKAAWINRHLSGGELLKLSRSENFDIVLGLSVLHHMEDYEKAFEGMNALGQWCFYEIPGPEDHKAKGKERHSGVSALFAGHAPIATFPSHVSKTRRPMYLLKNTPAIHEQTLDAKERNAPTYGKYRLESDFDSATIHIDRTARKSPLRQPYEDRDFVPGMNLHNFRLLGGGYPSEDYLEREMAKHSHPDHRPWNFVIGNGVTPIDTVRKR